MSVSEASDEDLTQDSVPDPPRAEGSARENGRNEIDKSRKVKTESDPKPSKSSKSKSSSRRPPEFGMPQGPATSSTINIHAASNVHIGNIVNINLSQKSRHAVEVPRKVQEIMKSCDVVSADDIDIVATHVGNGWRDVGKRLGFTEGQLTQIEKDAQQETTLFKEKVYQMLLSWKQEKDTEATVGVLCKCLWKSREYDAAKMFAKERS